ncbi:MAG TPA: rhomboid family intramembrane serine protease [candidate division Zixibacteria bacterium]
MSNSEVTDEPGYGRMTRIVKLLLIVNTAFLLLKFIGGSVIWQQTLHWLGLTPTMVRQGDIWQLFTYMFLHGGFFHLLFNMFTLWMFGCEIERSWGSREFLKYYTITGVGAGILTVVLTFILPLIPKLPQIDPAIPTIGASGAIFGILVAYALMFPNRLIYIWFLFPVKAKYLVAFFAVFTLIASFRYSGGGVAHFAHLGGMVVGYLYIKADWKLASISHFLRELRYKRRLTKVTKDKQEEMDIMEQVDRVLDKINAHGMDSLTNREKKLLEKASHLLSKR